MEQGGRDAGGLPILMVGSGCQARDAALKIGFNTREPISSCQYDVESCKKLGRRLVAAVDSPEEAINLIMKRIERSR